MKTKSTLLPFRLTTFAGAAALVLAGYGISNATVIIQDFATMSGDEGGIVKFTDSADDSTLAANQLKITFDNTTNGPTYSTAITGIVFNIDAVINSISSFSFFAGNGTDLTAINWDVEIDVVSAIGAPTKFDITFSTGNTIIGGIYNAADPGSNLNNLYPDIATLILTISDPNPYVLTSVGDDSVLRMQRAGTTGDDSLKLVTSTSSSTTSGGPSTGSSTSTTGGASTGSSGNIPEPGMISLLGIGLLGQAFLLRQRRRRLQK